MAVDPSLSRVVRRGTPVPDKLIAIIAEIDAIGNAQLTRLTVLKRWFACPGRVRAFALWVAARGASRNGDTTEAGAALLDEAHALLAGCHPTDTGPDPAVAQDLRWRLRDFQDAHKNLKWGPVRVVRDWNLLLVEEALAAYLWHQDSPSHGYRLAVDYCAHYDPRYGNGLNGPSRTRLEEMAHFMSALEAREDEGR